VVLAVGDDTGVTDATRSSIRADPVIRSLGDVPGSPLALPALPTERYVARQQDRAARGARARRRPRAAKRPVSRDGRWRPLVGAVGSSTPSGPRPGRPRCPPRWRARPCRGAARRGSGADRSSSAGRARPSPTTKPARRPAHSARKMA
jgi:hypothetical protein